MTTENIKSYLIDNYNKLAYTHSYIFGYTENGMVYGAVVMNGSDLLPYITSVDRASSKNGGTYSLKYKPNKAQLALIKERSCKIFSLCSVDFLEEAFHSSKQNRGQIFEALTTLKFRAETPKAKNAKFTDCGDIIVKGHHFQVKYLKATFTDERTLQNLL